MKSYTGQNHLRWKGRAHSNAYTHGIRFWLINLLSVTWPKITKNIRSFLPEKIRKCLWELKNRKKTNHGQKCATVEHWAPNNWIEWKWWKFSSGLGMNFLLIFYPVEKEKNSICVQFSNKNVHNFKFTVCYSAERVFRVYVSLIPNLVSRL